MTAGGPSQEIQNLHFDVLSHMGLSSHPGPLSFTVLIRERQTDGPAWVRCAPLAITCHKTSLPGSCPHGEARLRRGLCNSPRSCLLAGRAAGSQSRAHHRRSRRGSYVTFPLPGVCVPMPPNPGLPSSSLGKAGPLPPRQNQALLPLAPTGPRSCRNYRCLQPPN